MPTIYDNAFQRIIEALFEEQRSKWSNEAKIASPSTQKVKTTITNWNWHEIDENSLKKQLSDAHVQPIEFASSKWIMFLPPLEKEAGDFVPLISLEYHGNQLHERGCIKIRVLMISLDEKGYPFGLGFRIESPTSFCQDQQENENIRSRKHDFYHAQLITDFGYGPPLCLPDWLPVVQPSFPLWAMNPIDSVLILVLSLYGRKYYVEFIASHGRNFIKQTSDEFKRLNAWFKENSP